MDVKPGYKQTGVGVIPEEWEVVPVGQLLRRMPSYGINAPAVSFNSQLPIYLRITDITEDGKFAEATKMSVEDAAAESYSLESGDIVFARTGATVGKSYLYDSKDGRLVYAGFLIRLSPDPERLVPAFLSFYAQSPSYWNWVKVNSMRSGQPGINGREYASLPIPLPPMFAEQEAIAEALSDADALIESLEQLLTKKRQIKKGAMQELLTGKKRLPGFSTDWQANRLGSTAILKARIGWQGLTTNEYLDAGDYYLVTGTEFKEGYIDWDGCNYIDEFRYKQDKYIQLKERDVLVTKDGTIGKVALVRGLPKHATLNSGIFVIRPIKNAFCPEFFYYLLCSRVFTEFLDQLSAGSTINHLYQKNFVNFVYKTPATIVEQATIAAILSDIDAVIAVLEAKLIKARQIKQGMMQELLTGRIRLI